MKNALLILTLGLLMSACSSMPKLKDFNKIGAGMTRSQVIDKLGEPKTSKMVDGREILEYDARDEDAPEAKPRIVVLEDREVIFYGKPSEYARQQEKAAGGAGNGLHATISPTISPTITVSPTFTTSPSLSNASSNPQASAIPASIAAQYNKGERNISYHDVPEIQSTQEGK